MPVSEQTMVDQACKRLSAEGVARVEVHQVRAGVEVALSGVEELLKRALPYVAAERDETRVRDAWELVCEIRSALGSSIPASPD